MVSVTIDPICYHDQFLWKSFTQHDVVETQDLDMCPYFTPTLINTPDAKVHVTCADFAGNHGLLGLSSGKLMTYTCGTQKFTVVSSSLSFYEKASIKKVMLSPSGLYGLVCFSTGDTGLVVVQSAACEVLPSLKTVMISCAAWVENGYMKDNAAIEVLLGTEDGALYSALIHKGKGCVVQLLLPFYPGVRIDCVQLLTRSVFQNVSREENDALCFTNIRNVDTVEEKNNETLKTNSLLFHCIFIASNGQLLKFSGYGEVKQIFARVCGNTKANDSAFLSRDLGVLSKVLLRRVWEQDNCLPELDNYIIYEAPKLRGMSNIWIRVTDSLNPKTLVESRMASTPVNVFGRQEVVPYSNHDSVVVWMLLKSGVMVTKLIPVISKEVRLVEEKCDIQSSDPISHPCKVMVNAISNYRMACPVFLPFIYLKKKNIINIEKSARKFFVKKKKHTEFKLQNNSIQNMGSSHKNATWTFETSSQACVGFAITKYHLLLLFETYLIVVSRLTYLQVQYIPFPLVQYGKILTLIPNLMSDTTYLLTERYLYELVPQRETNTVWLHYMLCEDIGSAFKYPPDSLADFEIVYTMYLKALLREQKWKRATEITLYSRKSLEDFILRVLKYKPDPHVICTIVMTLASTLRKFYKKKTLLHSNSSNNQKQISKVLETRYLVTTQVWELMELIHNINQLELDIERIKQYQKNNVLQNETDSPHFISKTWNSLNVQNHKRIPTFLTQSIAYRKSLLHHTNRVLETLNDNCSLLKGGYIILAMCEYLGRAIEKITWSTLTGNREMQVVEYIFQDNYKSALTHLAKDLSVGTSKLDQGLCSNSNRESLMDQQIYLIGKYGPILFLREPSLFSSFLCNDEPFRTTRNSFYDCLQKRLTNHAEFLSIFLPIFLGAVNRKSYQYTTIHVNEALRVVQSFGRLLKLEHCYEKDQFNAKINHFHINHAHSSHWSGVTGFQNLQLALLTCLPCDTEKEIINFMTRVTLAVSVNHENIQFDFPFSLRFCVEKNKIEAVISLMTAMQMYSNAVSVALAIKKVDIATYVVNSIKDPWFLPLKKRLFKKILKTSLSTVNVI
ncbi:uncharacterized protein LOC128884285 isoform X2 [Hylaeus volcanicus]|uniref:uncharacterized protein LOC128884285 isoform X2 n=1 Tax=Hylaeus volcanicus TaxID=313075 RepID=UPI0023B7DBC6|nr:uncharacterized protein LOC128884285 isoform X2 [Hylaeus volcanicus]